MGNIKKTINYLKKNGIKDTYYAVKERISQAKQENYTYAAPTAEMLSRQRELSAGKNCIFSIIVPVYDPCPEYFCAMVDSVISQSYPHFELILADAGKNEDIMKHAANYQSIDKRIKYHRLAENKGISGNSNIALAYAIGDYVGLLDHDDLLTPDALYEMASAIEIANSNKITPGFLYSDEDKLSSDGRIYYDCHRKTKLNLDLILSNNYICHFLVMRREMIQTLGFRPDYDGAQDYDLILRAIETKAIVLHVDKVLYHWRSHADSTAENPQSKQYAYDAGKRAVEDFIRNRGYNGIVHHTKHLGFYQVEYLPDVFGMRPEVGIIGGKLLNKRNKITGGIYLADGTPLYNGLHKEYSGYMHRATLWQEADAIDIRAMKISPLAVAIFETAAGFPYIENLDTGRFDWRNGVTEDADFKEISLAFCKKVKKAGFTIVWDPQMIEEV
ncbi:MAG: glycosyltransferase [Lachnospiraceae bacterium]|nr:glycosyltransferase [Lachnospiraceae bacterium]